MLETPIGRLYEQSYGSIRDASGEGGGESGAGGNGGGGDDGGGAGGGEGGGGIGTKMAAAPHFSHV